MPMLRYDVHPDKQASVSLDDDITFSGFGFDMTRFWYVCSWHLAVDRASRRHLFAVSSQRQWCTHGLIQLSMSMPLRTFFFILLHAWHTGILVLLAFSVVDTCHFSGSLQGLGSVVNGQDPALYCTSVKTDASLCVAFPVHGLFDHLVHWYYLSCAGLQTGALKHGIGMKICPWQQHHLAPVYRQVPGIVCFVRGKYPWKHPTDVAHVQSPSLSRSSRQTRSMYECQKTAIFPRRLRGTVQEVVGTSVKRARHRGHLKWCQGKLCPSHLRQPGRHPSCSHPFIP